MPDTPNQGEQGGNDNQDSNQGGNEQTPDTPNQGEQGGDEQPVKQTDLSIHFLELGNKYTGDCTLIKTGNTEVLIDAGSRKDSATTINKYLRQYCTDGVLEYVIATHAHQDHIAGFVGTSGSHGVFDTFECSMIIDYPRTGASTQIRSSYESLRDKEVLEGAIHYTALECWKELNGAKRSYELGENITLNILYQEYYEKSTSSENNYSVCVLLSENENHYLFTGDLEEAGESSLVDSNDLPKCKLYKAGHHGSKTSSTTKLLQKIQPEIVCVSCCCGSSEYTTNNENQFPTQDFVNRVASWTDRVYVTTITSTNSKGFESMNGNIVVYWENGILKVRGSNNDTLLKDTAWFKANRTLPNNWKTA